MKKGKERGPKPASADEVAAAIRGEGVFEIRSPPSQEQLKEAMRQPDIYDSVEIPGDILKQKGDLPKERRKKRKGRRRR